MTVYRITSGTTTGSAKFSTNRNENLLKAWEIIIMIPKSNKYPWIIKKK